MSQEIWETIQKMETEDAELQLALQCAPLITGLKVSNLLSIKTSSCREVLEIIKESCITAFPLGMAGERITLLLYQKERLTHFFMEEPSAKLLQQFGYGNASLNEILKSFRRRYQEYLAQKRSFPHEMGLLLGYPPEDVEGFITHEGRDFLYAGEWKVYHNPEWKKLLFQRFDYARENLVQLLSCGMHMDEIIDVCNGMAPRRMVNYKMCVNA